MRDRAGEGLLAPDSVRRIAGAIGSLLACRERFPEDFDGRRGGTIFLGRDTRASGKALLDLVAEEFRAIGFPVADLGILPTAGVAYMASVSQECGLAVVLSASHNPAVYNGIKLLAPTGAKISPGFERAVSAAFHRRSGSRRGGRGLQPLRDLSRRARAEYVQFLVGRCRRPGRLEGRRIILDTAHGAACEVAPQTFRTLGMQVECIGDAPDGANINDGCGTLHPERLAAAMRQTDASVGFCFDGDADRVIPVTASGKVLSGDHVLALAGRRYHEEGRLPRRSVVATVMSNVGLEKSLAEAGLTLLRTPVGDRHVYRKMVEEDHPLGGEQSGHLIFLPDLPTGDGILAAVRLLDVLRSDDLDLEEEASIMQQYPQLLRNVRVREKVSFEQIPQVAAAVAAAEERLGTDGRVLLRYSGTEPLARVMLEGPDVRVIEDLCDGICRALGDSLPV